MLFSFTVNQALYLALARESAAPLEQALAELPAIPSDCQWASFVRNHDELTLDKLSAAEREEVFAAFGPEKELQLFGRGLRRRLPTMLGGDQQRIRMVYSLMFSLPGTPVLFYGEEIGMGENLAIEGRMSVRAPMQWSRRAATAASRPPRTRRRCAARSPRATSGPSASTPSTQRRDPDSLLNWIERLIRRRREMPRARLGRVHRARHRASPRSSPTAATGTTRPSSPSTTWPATTSTTRCRSRRRARSSTCSARTTSRRRTSSRSSRTSYRWYRLRPVADRV